MMINTQEHIDLMAEFEKEHKCRRLDKEPKDLWKIGRVYQDGHLNDLFIAFRKGYALARCVYIRAA